MKQSYFMGFYILSICMTGLHSTARIDEDVHRKQPSLHDANGYVRYRAAQGFSALAVDANDRACRRLIGELVQPFLRDSAPAVCWETVKAFGVLATNAENAEERLEVLNVLWNPLNDEDSTVNQEAAKGMLTIVNRADGIQERESIREELAAKIFCGHFRVRYTIVEMLDVLFLKAETDAERRAVRDVCSTILRQKNDWRVVELASRVCGGPCAS